MMRVLTTSMGVVTSAAILPARPALREVRRRVVWRGEEEEEEEEEERVRGLRASKRGNWMAVKGKFRAARAV